MKFFPDYSRTLIGEDAARYQAKIACWDGADPFELDLKFQQIKESWDYASEITREDLMEYLVYVTPKNSYEPTSPWRLTMLSPLGRYLVYIGFQALARHKALVLAKVSQKLSLLLSAFQVRKHINIEDLAT